MATETPTVGPDFGARVAARAADVKLTRLLLLAVAAVLFVPGYLVGLLWLCARWAVAALVEGFAAAQPATPDEPGRSET